MTYGFQLIQTKFVDEEIRLREGKCLTLGHTAKQWSDSPVPGLLCEGSPYLSVSEPTCCMELSHGREHLSPIMNGENRHFRETWGTFSYNSSWVLF